MAEVPFHQQFTIQVTNTMLQKMGNTTCEGLFPCLFGLVFVFEGNLLVTINFKTDKRVRQAGFFNFLQIFALGHLRVDISNIIFRLVEGRTCIESGALTRTDTFMDETDSIEA